MTDMTMSRGPRFHENPRRHRVAPSYRASPDPPNSPLKGGASCSGAFQLEAHHFIL